MSAWQLLGRLLLFAFTMTVLQGLVSQGPGVSIFLSGTSLGAHLSMGVVLALISRRHPGGFLPRFTSLFALIYGILAVNTAIELLFFSEMALPAALAFLALGAVATAVYAMLSSLLFRPEKEVAEERDTRWSGLKTHSAAGWTWRISAGVLTYLALYIVVGAIAFRYTGTYYTDPSYGLDLTVPSLGTVFMVQVARSFIFILALWPLAASVRCTRVQASALGGAALFVLGGLLPLLLNTDWPAPLRLYHTVEILFQNAPAGFVITWLIWSQRSPDQGDSTEPVHAKTHAPGVF